MNKDYKRLTEKRESPLVMSMWAGTSKDLKIYNRLAELEDKIENGTLVEFPRVIHPNRAEWFVQYQYPNGVIQYYICYSEAEAEAKLRELKEKENENS